MKFINFNSDKDIEQLSRTQLVGLVKLEQGNKSLFTGCDELNVVLLGYDTGERLCTEAAGRLATKTTKRFFKEKQNNLIAVVSKSQLIKSIDLKQTQLAIFDKDMRVILDYTFNSDMSVENVIEDILKGTCGELPTLEGYEYDKNLIIEVELKYLSKMCNIIAPLCKEKELELKNGQRLHTLDKLETEETSEI